MKIINSKRSDIIPIINSAWSKLFATVENNLKAIQVRGWDPLTHEILQHPEILSSKRKAEDEESIGTIYRNSKLSDISFDYITNDNDNSPNSATPNKKLFYPLRKMIPLLTMVIKMKKHSYI